MPDAGPRAHPRSRGENLYSSQAFRRRRGSSPLTRGKQRPGIRAGTQHGLIPAHAGKTSWRSWWASLTSPHPRSRGENQVRASRDGRLSGSSPLTRGKLEEGELSVLITRLIPAHAGKTEKTVQ
ncbi:hypothetical protein ACTODO_00516 [Schaalia dentiphila ATCC 17982]|nr:hypothetical protein ACTODO_00516 [Schaalia odontolytica ATCC 17982]